MKTNILALSAALLMGSAALVSCGDENTMLPDKDHLARKFDSQDRKLFVSPDKVFYPETWFHFIGGNVSHEGITADLEAIAAAGISGIHLFHGQFGGKWPETGEDITCLSEKWDDAVKYTAEECQRLGLSFTMQNCPGWAMSGGPWIQPENAMRDLVHSRTDVSGGEVDVVLPIGQPSSEEWRDYRDIAVVAFPTPQNDTGKPLVPKSVKGSGDHAWMELFTGKKIIFPRGGETHWAELTFEEPVVIRGVEYPPLAPYDQQWCYEPDIHFTVYAIMDDGTREVIVDADIPQTNWQDYRHLTFACADVEPTTTFRMELQTAHDIPLGNIYFYTGARKNNWEAETAWTLRAFERTGDDVVHSSEAYVQGDAVVDISECMAADGRLKWTAPDNNGWTILRMGHVNKGARNAPAPPEGTGWECDKLSTDGPDAHFAGYIGRLTNGALQGGKLQSMLLDSWECYSQTWTKNMEQEFEEYAGYDLRKWIPALWGYVVDDPETTSRFLLDWRNNIGRLFVDKFYKRMADLGHEQGLLIRYETSAGDVFPADCMEYYKYADIPMCEYWQPFTPSYVGALEFKPIKPTASAAHIYGKPRVAAESLTSFTLIWDEHFDMLKEVANFNAVEGVTHTVFHTYTHNPQIDYKKPGTSFGASIGTPFLRGQTWWKYMPEFTTYLARCSYMLERGTAVSDVLWYLGDEVAHRPDQDAPFPESYKYDYCNPDVLLNRLSVVDGRLVTPEGYSYNLLWIPENKRMLPETLEKLQSLVEQGAVVVANAPQRIATLRDAEKSEARFAAAVQAIWGDAKAGEITTVGKGKVLSGVGIECALKMLSLPADVVGDVRWLHRSVKGADWYFVTPQQHSSFIGEVKFHAVGCVELWDPVTGDMIEIPSTSDGEYTTVELNLPQSGSCFIVFDNNKKPGKVQAPEALAHSIILNNDWSVEFPAGWGAPEKITTNELKAWKDMIESAEGKSFSGTATYTTTFAWDTANQGQRVELDLGRVDMIAEVQLNGQPVRTLWCMPYSVDISDYIQAGENQLTVKVTSTWFNRLVYDASLPETERKTWTISGPAANNPLRESGLMGDVVLKY